MLGVNTKLLILFIVLVAMLVLFVWNRWRYDIVALVALLVVAVAGLVPPSQVVCWFWAPCSHYCGSSPGAQSRLAQCRRGGFTCTPIDACG